MAATPMVSSLKGTGYKSVQMPKLSPDQQQLFSQVFQGLQPGLGSSLSRLGAMAAGDEGAFAALEAPAMRDFQAGLGQIGSRFSGMGMGARRSSGFGLTSTNAAQELAEKLQAQRLGLQQNAISQLMSLYGNLMGQDVYDSFLMEPKAKIPLWKQLAAGGLTAAGTAAGAYFGGPMGAATGAQLGSGLGNALLGKESNMSFEGIGKLPTKWGR